MRASDEMDRECEIEVLHCVGWGRKHSICENNEPDRDIHVYVLVVISFRASLFSRFTV